MHDGQGDQLVIADVEFDMGLLPRLELDLDASLVARLACAASTVVRKPEDGELEPARGVVT